MFGIKILMIKKFCARMTINVPCINFEQLCTQIYTCFYVNTTLNKLLYTSNPVDFTLTVTSYPSE